MKKIIVPLVIVVVVLGGYFLFNSKSEKEPTVQSESASKKMSFEEFLKKDSDSYVCITEQSVSGLTSSGTMYIANSKDGASRQMHGEFKTSVQGMNIETNFIMKDGFYYSWSSTLPNMGYKMKIQDQPQTGNSGAEVSGTYNFNASQIGAYDCKKWSVDESKFEIPVSIKFIEPPTLK